MQLPHLLALPCLWANANYSNNLDVSIISSGASWAPLWGMQADGSGAFARSLSLFRGSPHSFCSTVDNGRSRSSWAHIVCCYPAAHMLHTPVDDVKGRGSPPRHGVARKKCADGRRVAAAVRHEPLTEQSKGWKPEEGRPDVHMWDESENTQLRRVFSLGGTSQYRRELGGRKSFALWWHAAYS